MKFSALLGLCALMSLGCTDKKPAIKPLAPASTADGLKTAAGAVALTVESDRKPKHLRTKKPNKKVTNPKRISSLKRAPIAWDAKAGWLDWDAGVAAAKASKKPICLVLYADWCPRCKELAPVFDEGEIATLSKDMVMIRQNIDERPKWLEPFSSLGNYVPRVFFFDADGNIKDDVTSGHARYPYFYTPAGRKALEASMRKALGKT